MTEESSSLPALVIDVGSRFARAGIATSKAPNTELSMAVHPHVRSNAVRLPSQLQRTVSQSSAWQMGKDVYFGSEGLAQMRLPTKCSVRYCMEQGQIVNWDCWVRHQLAHRTR